MYIVKIIHLILLIRENNTHLNLKSIAESKPNNFKNICDNNTWSNQSK